MRPFRITRSIISLDAALEYLDNDKDLFNCLSDGSQGFKRSLLKKEELQDNLGLAQFLRKVLVFNRSEDDLKSNPSLNKCYKMGWLQAEQTAEDKTIYVFPTRIHQRYNPSNIYNCYYYRLISSLDMPRVYYML